jgi:pyruvate formate lyase activating enzyme
MTAVLERIKDAPALQRVEMLRYHRTAGAKYAMAGRDYSPQFDIGQEVSIHNVFEENHIKNIIL